MKVETINGYESTISKGDTVVMSINPQIKVIVTKSHIQVYDGETINSQLMIRESNHNLRLIKLDEAEERCIVKREEEKFSVLPYLSLLYAIVNNTLNSIKFITGK